MVVTILFMLPPYITNSAPILLGGGPPLDFGRTFLDGQRILGANKTVLGLISALLAGSFVSLTEGLLISAELAVIGVVASCGAVVGGLIGAFIKRRMRLSPGSPAPLLDQLDFLCGAVILAAPYVNLSLGSLLLLFILTPPIHMLTNAGAYFLGLKKTAW